MQGASAFSLRERFALLARPPLSASRSPSCGSVLQLGPWLAVSTSPGLVFLHPRALHRLLSWTRCIGVSLRRGEAASNVSVCWGRKRDALSASAQAQHCSEMRQRLTTRDATTLVAHMAQRHRVAQLVHTAGSTKELSEQKAQDHALDLACKRQ